MRGGCFSSRASVLPVMFFMALVYGCGTPATLEQSRQFQDAEKRFSEAKTESDFVNVAMAYQEILDGGFHSGIVFYNQGNAWFQANQRGRAIASYRQAARLLPRDPYVRANLKQALSGAKADAAPGMADYLFFWKEWLNLYEMLVLTTALLSVSLSLLVFAQWRKSGSFRRVGITVVCLTLVSGLAMTRDWVNQIQTQHAVIISETVARKGSAESYEPSFNQPLREGTEATVVKRRDDWLLLQIADTGEGWVPQRFCVTY